MKLFDKVFNNINEQLAASFPWLNNLYGKSQILVNNGGRLPIRFPVVYRKDGSYDAVYPDQTKGNFVFHILGDPQIVNFKRGHKSTVTAKTSIVLWVNLNTLSNTDTRDLESIKSELLNFFSDKLRTPFYSLTVSHVWEGAKNIYQEYSLSEIKDQYLMQPFAGLRFDLKVTVKQYCNE